MRRKFKDDGYFWGYLIIFLIALELGFKTMVHSRLFLQFPFFFAPGRFYNLLLYPTFLMFILSISQKRPLSNKWKWMLMAPLLGYALYQFGKLFFMSSETKLTILHSFYQDNRPGPFNYWSNLGTLLKTVIVPLLFLVPIAYYFLGFLRNSKSRPDKTLTLLLSTSILAYSLFTLTSNSIYRWLFGTTQISMIEWPVDIVFLSFMAALFCMVILLVNTGSSFFSTG
ncbi:hypothetical protein DX873_08405 [Flagellimonas nanhaiensis]|uniref:Uncharacterized protein n=1 Tax=Flagellimonas nanhaiensis TaxID=2292706 RepID=A0A371JPG1_9FLAO|nr:hypothetical protein DX873_08405 [Allomuricauda nanhaiensis]